MEKTYKCSEKRRATARASYHTARAKGAPARSRQKTYEENKGYAVAYRARIKKDVAWFLRAALKNVKGRAKRNGLLFDLDVEWLQKQPLQCAITGKKFEIPDKGWGPLTPSFDQRIPGAGYTRDNTQIICLWVNVAKRDWPETEIRALIREAAPYV